MYTNKIMVMETANLPSSAVTKLGSYLIAVGLAKLAKGDAMLLASSFLKQLLNIQNLPELRAYGVKAEWLSTAPGIASGFASSIKEVIVKTISNDPTVTTEELKYIKFALNFATTPDKDSNYVDRARKFSTLVSSAFLRNFEKVVDKISKSGGLSKGDSRKSVEDLYDELDSVMEDILNRPLKIGEKSVPAEFLKTYGLTSTSAQELTKEYKRLRRQLSVDYDVDFARFMSNKNGLMPVHEVYKYMKSLGYRDHKVLTTDKPLPLQVGLLNGKVKYYTQSGKPLATGIPANSIDVKFPKTYNESDGTGAYVTYTAPEAVGISKVYTEQHASSATKSKFDTADEVNESIDKVLAYWRKDLKSSDTLTQMAATACMLVYLTGMRVGSRQNSAASATGEKTFGAISLRPRHVVVGDSRIIIKYSGKKAVEQKHIIKVDDTDSRLIAKNLTKYLQGKQPKSDDLLFSYVNERGTDKVLSYSLLNKYLDKSGYPAGLHKIRHVRGTNLIAEILAKTQWKPSVAARNNLAKRQKEAEIFIVEKVITPATILLGHKAGTGKLLWRTTVKSYINPQVLIQWFDKQELRRPSWLPSKASAE